ncbi:MAG: hypothetical protein IPN13_14860 [Bacteroidetes bacterium]|nr:hypothetical protein [Bacteroidota bacterium]
MNIQKTHYEKHCNITNAYNYFISVVAIQSCKDDEDEPNTPAPQEFIATSTTFRISKPGHWMQ